MSKGRTVDKPFLIIVLILIIGGFLIFSSASLGLLTQGSEKFSQVTFNQTVLGLVGGIIFGLITWKFDYRIWRKYALLIFIFAIILNILLFIPGLGISHGGARRWIDLGFISFQTSEILKIGFIIYLAAWLSSIKEKVSDLYLGLLPFCVLLVVPAVLLMLQPDTDTLAILFMTSLAMFFTAGGKWRHVLLLVVVGLLALGAIALSHPYVMQRITTFLNPEQDPLGASYQIQQSLIAIGSGGTFGRGFGKSLQKFNNFLPEPIGDSIFAVMAEEFGFVGSVGLIFLFIAFAIRGFMISVRAPDSFGGLLTLGIVILIVSQSFINIGAMLGVLPLSGIPLLFVSHGGTALFITLVEVGIILNISKQSHV